jgi:DNA-binding transcriptional regulator YdaS (Cro superfamily)
MLLSTWLVETGTPVADVAAAAEVHPGSVYKWLNGRTMPRPAQLAAIVRLTGGRVTAADAAAAYMAHQAKRKPRPNANHGAVVPHAEVAGIVPNRRVVAHAGQPTVKTVRPAITIS